MDDETPTNPQRWLRPTDSHVIVDTGDVIVWRDNHRGVVEYTKGGKRRVATLWVDEDDGFPQLAHSEFPAGDRELEEQWAQIVAEGKVRLEAGLKRLREG